jgi:predicted ATPase/class 3 adenylate cyclase
MSPSDIRAREPSRRRRTRALPTGTVTFLFTDIEGSTELLQTLGSAFLPNRDRHDRAIRRAIKQGGGIELATEGDSFFAVFRTAVGAVHAAVAAQRVLSAAPEAKGRRIAVRMGLHTGDGKLGGDNYVGMDVHRAARIAAAGHGGQVLLSDATRGLVESQLPDGVTLRDLGSQTLKDLPHPEHLHDLLITGLRADFPGLRTISGPRGNLPTSMTRFIGRTREAADIGDLLARERMVTLAGPGGTGKTRLAIEAARSLADRYPDGSWFVALEALRDPALVVSTIATTLGVRDQPGRPISAVLGEYLLPKHVLVLLDNLEQVIRAAPEIAGLLGAAPGLDVLATSREPLSIAGEHVYHVPPLDLPPEPGVPTARDLAANEAVELFMERARAARADFALSDANAPAIAAICRRLDGLPLAIELAAARINVLSANQIVDRLDHRLKLLATDRRDLPERQRTLRGAIDWSYDLLARSEQAFFRRLSVFSGGADLDAISAVVDPEGALGADALELASALVDRSLLRLTAIGDENRLDMLETIREYAAEHLAASSSEESETRARHADYYRELAEASEGLLLNVRRDQILDRLDRELNNVRAAIAWSLETGHTEIGLRIAVALREFWHVRNRILEGRRALDGLLSASASEGATSPRFRALAIGGGLASWHGDYDRSLELFEEALAMAEARGSRRQMAAAKSGMGWAMIGSRPTAARPLIEEAVALARERGDTQILYGALQGLTLVCIRLGDLGAARRSALESIALGEAAGERYSKELMLVTLGMIEAREGDRKAGGRRIAEALRQLRAAGGHIGLSIALDTLATLVLEQGESEHGAILAAAADRLRREIGGGPGNAVLGLEEPLDHARRTMAESDFERAVAAGAALTTDEAVDLGLEVAERGIA